jgi:hypothetical protein
MEGAVVAGGASGASTGNFKYDWTHSSISAFAFATPLGKLDSTQSGNTASVVVQNGYTALNFSNSQVSMTLYYAGAPTANAIGFFSGALCTAKAPCTVGTSQVPVSTLLSNVWSSNPVWVPNLVWVPSLVWVPNLVWVSNWVWVSDITCNAYDSAGNCTDSTDNGYYEDDGSYVDEGSTEDDGSFVDEGGYVDTGAYPTANFTTGLTVRVP